MDSVNKALTAVAATLGEDFVFDGYMLLHAHIKNGIGKTIADVLGFDYTVHGGGKCWEYYAALPPLIGLTQAKAVPCLIGIRIFKNLGKPFSEIIDIFHKLNCGDMFTTMDLSWAMTPQCTEPYWHLRTNIGTVVAIGAYTGTTQCFSQKVEE